MSNAPGVTDSGAQFPNNLGYTRIPYQGDCTGLHFFGGSESQSLVNHAVPSQPLVTSGGAVVSYGDNYAQLAQTAGFSTTGTHNINSLTLILAMGASYRLSDGIRNPATYMQIHTFSRTAKLKHVGTYDLYDTGLLDADVEFKDYLAGGPYGSRTRLKRRFVAELTAISSDSDETLMVAEDLGPIISRTNTVDPGNGAIYDGADSPLLFGGKDTDATPPDVVWRGYAMMTYNRRMSEAEITDVWQNFLGPALEHRGCETYL